MKEENQIPIGAILAFVAGTAIGKNWDEIKKYIQPYLKEIEKQYGNASFASMGVMSSQKEKLEDLFAEWQEKKKTKKVKPQVKKKGSKK